MNWRVLGLGTLVTVPLLIFLALAFRSDPREIVSPLLGKPAPPFELTALDGRSYALQGWAGKPVVVNFWATWCVPCIAEHGVLLEGARRYQGQAEFVGIVFQDEPEPVTAFLAQRGSWGISLLDPESEVALRYGVYGAPETFFIDGGGVVRFKHTGPLRPAELESYLTQTLEAGP